MRAGPHPRALYALRATALRPCRLTRIEREPAFCHFRGPGRLEAGQKNSEQYAVTVGRLRTGSRGGGKAKGRRAERVKRVGVGPHAHQEKLTESLATKDDVLDRLLSRRVSATLRGGAH